MVIQTTFISITGKLHTVADENLIIRDRQSERKIPLITYSPTASKPYTVFGYDSELNYAKNQYDKPFTEEQVQEWYQQQLLLMKLVKLFN